MAGEGMDKEAAVALERISGDIRLIRQSQEAAERSIELRERSHMEFQRATNERLHTHGNRLMALESGRQQEAGVALGVQRVRSSMAKAYTIGAGATGLILTVIGLVLRSRGF